jgi:hypothetical protein
MRVSEKNSSRKLGVFREEQLYGPPLFNLLLERV